MAGSTASKPERKAEARRIREAQIRKRQRRAVLRKAGWVLLAAALIASAITVVLLRGPQGKAETRRLNALATQAGCTPLHSETFTAGIHIPQGQIAQYTTTPPIGGAHYNVPGLAPITTGVHDSAIQNEIQVHNLEHGHVGIQYNEIDPSLLDQLKALPPTNPDWIFVAPYRAMSAKLALTSWGHLITCAAPNAQAVALAREFIKDFRDHAPESIPGTPST